MTDKELKKLSRLELLEMLLEVSKENEKLRKSLEKTKLENKAAKSIANLSATTKQMNTALEYVNSLTDILRKTTLEIATAKTAGIADNQRIQSAPSKIHSSVSDRNLYWRIIAFYARNDSALQLMPDDIQSEVRNRIKSILESRKRN